jgi:hypothetical protein
MEHHMSRARYAIVEKDGELQTVLESTLDGYEGWSVIQRGITHPPEHHKGHDGKRWITDADAKAKARRRARAHAIPREELVDRLEAIEARVAELEKRNAAE